MINIKHPKIQGKPPVKRTKDVPTKDVEFKEKEIAENSVVSKDNEVNDDSIGIAEMEKSVFNPRNVVESTTCSFEQLCNMISDLEKDVINEVPGMIPEIPDHQLQLKPEKDTSEDNHGSKGTLYADITSFLTKLEEDSLNKTKVNMPEVDAVILREIFGDSPPPPYINYDSLNPSNIENNSPYAFKEDLATARLQLEEKSATITLLKEQLKSERKLSCEKLNAQKQSNTSKLQQQENKYKGIIKRHQKFIERLISEKTDLTEKCNSLAERVKEVEIKMERDQKAAADRHMVELQRAKEHYAAAEKIKRERWIETRTTKIKEMTVKGLEPELRNMLEQHADEIQRIRNAHMKELQDVELRIIRRSNQQLEQLRLELTACHEKTLTSEKNILWARYKEKLEEQENQFKMDQTRLMRELQQDREKYNKERAKWDAEKEATLQQMHLQYQQEIEALKQRHSNEKKVLQESLRVEWEAWLTDYKRQQNARIEQAESSIRDKCNSERDRQIELAIERLEKDSRNEKFTLQQNFDCKLRSLREKFERDLQTAIDNERFHKDKLTQTKDKLDHIEIQFEQVENKLQQHIFDLNGANEVIKRLIIEKDHAKKLARQEIEGEKRELEEKIASLYQEITRINANRDASMAQLHSRIKLVMTQKILAIKNLNKELNDVKLKCQHLEKLLDQQRREYILKDL